MPSTSQEAHLFNPDPAAYLPHRAPFLFLDRIISLDPGNSAVALVNRTGGTEGWPIYLCVEAMAQLGGIASATEEGGGGVLAAIERAEFHGVPVEGDRLEVAVRVVKSFGPLSLVEGTVSADDRLVANATITLKIGRLL